MNENAFCECMSKSEIERQRGRIASFVKHELRHLLCLGESVYLSMCVCVSVPKSIRFSMPCRLPCVFSHAITGGAVNIEHQTHEHDLR